MMAKRDHEPYYRGYECVCSSCGIFLYDVRTGRRLRALTDVDPVKLGAVEARWTDDPVLAQRLAHEDMREVVSTYKLADKFNDFLMNPKARPDLQTPEAQDFLNKVKNKYLNAKTDEIMPWITREWKKGRIRPHPSGMPGLQYQGHPDYNYYDNDGNETNWHNLGEGEMDHWGDWYRSDHPSRKGKDIMQMKSPDMHQTIRDWDTDMRNRADSEAQSRGNILYHYPDGWSVQQLRTPRELTDEGDAMGHCVGSYAGAVENGHSLIYSLRDHNNQPHATWEVTPRPDKVYDPNSNRYIDNSETMNPAPQGGTMEQIQGKGNEPPIPAYQARIKEYMEHAMPDQNERPKWDSQHYDNLGAFMDPEGYNGYVAYHPGDYGLNIPATTYDWPEMVSTLNGWGEFQPDEFVKKAVEHGQFEPMANAAKEDIEERRDAKRENLAHEWMNHGAADEFASQFGEFDPEPQPEDEKYNEGDYDTNGYNQDWTDWEAREEEARNEHEREYIRQREMNDHDEEGERMNELETEIAVQERRNREAAEGQQQSTVAKVAHSRPSHPNFTTGEPCHCTFYKSPMQVEAVFMDEGEVGHLCPTCGDVLDHGQCKRCDWGGWSNAMGPGDNNPSDPTKELKPAIQASTQRWRPE